MGRQVKSKEGVISLWGLLFPALGVGWLPPQSLQALFSGVKDFFNFVNIKLYLVGCLSSGLLGCAESSLSGSYNFLRRSVMLDSVS